MGRCRKRFYEEYRQEFENDESFEIAYKQVKRIKDFYSHLKVYLIVNAVIIISNLSRDFSDIRWNEGDFFEWHTYSTAIFWGIGLAAHALSVFGRNIFFSDDWEKRKIQEYMSKQPVNKNKWE
ncbi:2TM domain-containing protein [Flavobacterium pectinovorum]|uniref:2TM domain-containing protein n=1 Tax=Flavobacterium pectinovorum TaxID=29533 RepID=UPI001FAC9194|nr:2TM domain-containing protein [Flavobacterium pectinovorum]MCI9844767.1 2TM domain-containing protein [Flavobacterium pectinovorum]